MKDILYALVVLPIVLIIAMAIFGGFQSGVDTSGWSTEAQTAFEKTTSGTWKGYNLASILPFVAIALGILGLVVAYLRIK